MRQLTANGTPSEKQLCAFGTHKNKMRIELQLSKMQQLAVQSCGSENIH